MDLKRLFVAVELPDAVKEELEFVSKHFEEIELFKGKFTEKENFHITLNFIGEVEQDYISEIDNALKEVCANSGFASLKNLGVLPSRRVPRVLFADLDSFCLPIIYNQISSVIEPLREIGVIQEVGIRARAMEIIDLGYGKNTKDKDNIEDGDNEKGAGFNKESESKNRKYKEREFKNHITLARIKDIKNLDEFLYAVDNFNLPAIKFEIKEFELKESELFESGPVYKTLAKYKLY